MSTPMEVSLIDGTAAAETNTTTAENDDDKYYSVWKITVDNHIFLNDGFQINDFQCNPGGPSLIDPNVYRKLRNEWHTIWTQKVTTKRKWCESIQQIFLFGMIFVLVYALADVDISVFIFCFWGLLLLSFISLLCRLDLSPDRS